MTDCISGSQAEDAEHEGTEDTTQMCGVCLGSAPKYTCPACGLRSCSLPCTKAHKAASGKAPGLEPVLVHFLQPSELQACMHCSCAGCTGKRSRTGFVRLGKFGERELVSDFRFLEEAALLGEAAGRKRRRLEAGGAQSAGALGFMLRQVGHVVPNNPPHACAEASPQELSVRRFHDVLVPGLRRRS